MRRFVTRISVLIHRCNVANNRAETQFLAVRTFRMFDFEDFPPVPE